MSRKFLVSAPVLLLYALASLLTGCSSSNNNNNNNHNPAAIAATSGSGQTATVSTAFASPLVATVTDSSGSPVTGASVTFTAPSSGASGSFANSTATESDTTDSSGVATSSTFTANSTTGSYSVTAAVSGVSTPASFSLTNASTTPTSTAYVFYASGTELPNAGNGNNESYYALAGAVQIDSSGNVVGGEEDYNDSNGITEGGLSGAVAITGGTLTVDATGQGTLTLITGLTDLGISGTETLGVQFANTNHAIITQFDASAASSGSMDMQTSASGSGGSFSFVLSGVDASYAPAGYGGVYSISSGAITGTADANDGGSVTLGNAFTGQVASPGPDSFGRAQITGVSVNGTALSLFSYNVGTEVIRLIDMDPFTTSTGVGGAMIGSAYGQGSGSFTASSLVTSVIGMQGNPASTLFALAGSIVPTPTSGTNTGTFIGTVDDNEQGAVFSDTAISGNYTVSGTANGYASLTIPSTPLNFLTNVGVYLTDPTLNLLDPNNTSGGGGALVLDLDAAPIAGGVGVMIPQTDTAAASFTGNYTLGAQEFNAPGGGFFVEFDYVGQGSVTSGAIAATGLVNDPFAYFGPTAAQYTAVAITGTATADPNEAATGRYTVNPFVVDASTGSPFDNLSINIYQANGGQLLFMEDSQAGSNAGLGSFQTLGSLSGLPAARHPVKKAQKRAKR